MKHLLVLFALAFCLAASGQRTVITDSIVMPAGTDTTVYIFNFFGGGNWGVSFDYSALDDVDGTIDLGGVEVIDGTVFNRLDDLRLPFTLSGDYVAFEKAYFSFKYLAIKFTPNSCTAGTITYIIKKL